MPQPSTCLEQQIWADYDRRMAREKGRARPGSLDTLVKRYSLPQVYAWLGWLASV